MVCSLFKFCVCLIVMTPPEVLTVMCEKSLLFFITSFCQFIVKMRKQFGLFLFVSLQLQPLWRNFKDMVVFQTSMELAKENMWAGGNFFQATGWKCNFWLLIRVNLKLFFVATASYSRWSHICSQDEWVSVTIAFWSWPNFDLMFPGDTFCLFHIIFVVRYWHN